jgi:hypothetical protein
MEKHYLEFIEQHGFKIKPKEGYYEKHHIIPKCMGGSDNPENLIWLSFKDHIRAHIILSESYPDNYKLAFAVNSFRNREMYGKEFTEEELNSLEQARLVFIKNHPAKNPEFAKKFSGENSPAKKNASTREKISKWNRENPVWGGKKRPEHSKAIAGGKNGRAKKIQTPLGVFETIIEASRAIGVNRNQIVSWANNENINDYFFIELN